MRAELRTRDYAGVVFADAINLRYATDARNMQIWSLRNPARYVFIATDGPVVLFEFAGCRHLAKPGGGPLVVRRGVEKCWRLQRVPGVIH